ncbi:hypothetical protein EYF80_037004 [Liparis tanakae]|uniref:Uncharacterized protein n=1 Tax=Liparis tanakae TaxID=230148 RepID=A0A4Z2GHU4_9TELE|nr:hypothetical protein EYF80_037004 [Liparis tanakae]
MLKCDAGYSCLQGYENVRKAHSIFSYVNSHFPPEQTHFPGTALIFPFNFLQLHKTMASTSKTRSSPSHCCCRMRIEAVKSPRLDKGPDKRPREPSDSSGGSRLTNTAVPEEMPVLVTGSLHRTSLLLGDLVCKQSIAYHQVALRDVEAFFSHAGGDQEVDDTLTEFLDRARLLVLRGKHERTESRETKKASTDES